MHDERARYLPEILDACAALAALVEECVRDDSRPLVLGGDHSIAMGTLAGLAAAAGQPGGVIWIDAHGDLNTPETSPSGNVHGMPLAAALGRSPPGSPTTGSLPRARPIPRRPGRDPLPRPGGRAFLREADIRVFTMSDIDRIGIEHAMREALDRVAGPGFVHVSLDLDSLDPEVAPGVGTPVPGGLTYREAHLACELIAESGIVGRSSWSSRTRFSIARTPPRAPPSSSSRARSVRRSCNASASAGRRPRPARARARSATRQRPRTPAGVPPHRRAMRPCPRVTGARAKSGMREVSRVVSHHAPADPAVQSRRSPPPSSISRPPLSTTERSRSGSPSRNGPGASWSGGR